MALYNYTKDYSIKDRESNELIIRDYVAPKKNLIEKLIGFPLGFYSELKNLTNKSRAANLLIPSILIFFGFLLIYKEFIPDIQQNIEQNLGYLTKGNISPVSDEYINLSNYISRPVDFPSLTASALNEHILEEDSVSINYRGTYYITIPSLGIKRLPVEANVDSTSESSYLSVLNTKLAHFKNTGLPISSVKNNILIYGHSASPNYNPRREDPMVAFSFLPDLKVGDDIFLDIEDKTYRFKMTKSMTTEATDTSVITGSKGKRTLTLVTCFPLGSNQSRYVAIARPVE